uniref:Putative muscle myosin heavy chain n=1 Tax=Ornithodoros turicata TaxID=34597 RepID=A0A2R5LHM4_9ACAR
MSWFSEIAGKAEDFLTKVDQTAASALQKPLLPQATSTILSYTRTPESSPARMASYKSQLSSNILGTPKPPLPSTSKAASTTPPKPNVAKKDEDEKLFEFLNSPEPAGVSTRKSTSQQNLPVAATKRRASLSSVEESTAASQPLKSTQNETSLNNDDKPPVNEEKAEDPDPAASGDAAVKTPPAGEDARMESVETPRDGASLQLGASQEETKMLQKEVTSLNQEIAAVLQRAKNAELEKKHLQNRLDHWNSQVSSSDSTIRELQARERDLTAVLDAKDAQLAVLRVRLQEADQELTTKRQLVDQLRDENQSLSKEQTDTSQVQRKTVDALRDKLAETEDALRKEQESHRQFQAEMMQRQIRLEEELRNLSDSLTLTQRQLSDQKAQNKDLTSQLSASRSSCEMARQELVDYKQKAQRILQSKEKLISSLKDAANSSSLSLDVSDADVSRAAAELESTNQECELLREELRKAQAQVEAAVSDLQDQEATFHKETEALQEQQRALLEELRTERRQRQEAELDVKQNGEEVAFLKDELRRTKDSLQQRLSERDSEVERLRKQIATKSMSTTSEAELEARLHALTESLIQKQTLVEALGTEKNSLALQLERLENQLKDAHTHNSRNHTAIGGFTQPEENTRSRVPGMFVESPFDGSVTRKVKRAYGVIDSFSVRAGIFLRRYPLARIFILIYMGLLHFWVMIVLLTYEPEIHGPPTSNKTKL